jgi:type I restriction enzyme S subunit
VGKFVPDPNLLNNRFLYHWLILQNETLYVLAGGGAQPNLSSNVLKEKLQIPIPPLAEQARIAAILDKFDTLTHSISEGLPREIELRQKQYEHYRNLLLSFPKPEEGTTKSTKSTK